MTSQLQDAIARRLIDVSQRTAALKQCYELEEQREGVASLQEDLKVVERDCEVRRDMAAAGRTPSRRRNWKRWPRKPPPSESGCRWSRNWRISGSSFQPRGRPSETLPWSRSGEWMRWECQTSVRTSSRVRLHRNLKPT
jgi:hypothetical protein